MQISKGILGVIYCLHIIDQYSKYPKVVIITSTSFKKLRPVLDRTLATHGIPESMTSDNGSPYSIEEIEEYATEKGFWKQKKNFVMQLCQLTHTATAEGKSPKIKFYNFLLHYCSALHSATNVCPAEILFNQKLSAKLPNVFMKKANKEIPQIGQDHA